MRSSLVKVAQILSIECEKWDTASGTLLVRQIRRKWSEAFSKSLENLSEGELLSVLNQADENLKKRAQRMELVLYQSPAWLLVNFLALVYI